MSADDSEISCGDCPVDKAARAQGGTCPLTARSRDRGVWFVQSGTVVRYVATPVARRCRAGSIRTSARSSLDQLLVIAVESELDAFASRQPSPDA
jgi:hypothetical protein